MRIELMTITRRQALQVAAASLAKADRPVIGKVELFPAAYPFVGHFKFNRTSTRATIFVKITCEDGTAGWGQSVPAPTWSYETPEAALSTLEKYLAPALIGRDPFDIAGAHAAMSSAIRPSFSTGMPITKAGIDLALHDLAGRLRGQSMPERWGRKPLLRIPLSWTVNPLTLDETGKLVEQGQKRGYRHFNIKVAPDKKFDLELCRQMRKLVPDCFLGRRQRRL